MQKYDFIVLVYRRNDEVDVWRQVRRKLTCLNQMRVDDVIINPFFTRRGLLHVHICRTRCLYITCASVDFNHGRKVPITEIGALLLFLQKHQKSLMTLIVPSCTFVHLEHYGCLSVPFLKEYKVMKENST